jgi:hypothetical protein
MQAAAAFLQALIEAVPYRIHTVHIDNGIQFADLPKNCQRLIARFRGHPLSTGSVSFIELNITPGKDSCWIVTLAS